MNQKGQNMLEYLLLFVVVIVVLLVFLSPGGFFSRSLDQSLDSSVNGFISMANSLNLD